MKIHGLNDTLGNSGLTTLISIPERGRFGKSSYRGNYAGDVMVKLVHYLQKNGIRQPYLFDPMVGGGTTKDVAEHMKVPYVVDDIHSGFDVVNDSWHDTGFDLTMLHYPYWKMVDYASDLPKELQGKDMSRMEWKDFMEAVNHVNLKAAAHSRYIAVLVGDMAYKGFIKSIQKEMVWPGSPVRHIIKAQHNAQSYEKKYKGNFIPIVTEHLLLFKTDYKMNGELWILTPGIYRKVDIDEYVTWETAIKHVMKGMAEITPKEVFEKVKRRFPVKLKKTRTPEATVRRTLQEMEQKGAVKRTARGIYQVA